MTSTKLLLFRPEPYPDESLNSYIARLATANHYPNVYWITKLACTYHESPYLPNDEFLRNLSGLVHCSTDALRALTLHRFAADLNPLGSTDTTLSQVATLRYVHHKRSGIRFCPTCLRTLGYWRLLWQLRMVTVCPTHKCLLCDRCPRCRRAVTFQRLKDRTCACGQCLDLVETPVIDRSAAGFVAQSTIQQRLLNASSGTGMPNPTWFASLDFLQNWLASFPAGALQVDHMDTAEKPERWPRFSLPVKLDYIHYTHAVEVLEGGRELFFELCRAWLQDNKVECLQVSGYHKDFRKLSQSLASYPCPEFDHIHNWLAEFLASAWNGGYPSRIRSLPTVETTRVTLSQAAKVLKLHIHNVAQLIRSGSLKGTLLPLDPSGKLKGLVDAKSLQQAKKRREQALPLHEAAHRIGLHPDVLSGLYYAKVLTAERGPITDGQTTPALHPIVLDNFIGRLNGMACKALPGMTPLSRFSIHHATHLLEQVLKGDRPASLTIQGGRILNCVVGDRTADTTEIDDKTTESQSLSVRSAADLLGLTPSVVQLLIDTALLHVADGLVTNWREFVQRYAWEVDAALLLGVSIPILRRWTIWRRFSPVITVGRTGLYLKDDLARFAPENRCTVKEAARILALSHPQELQRQFLRHEKLKPISGPGVDQGREIFLCRQEVEAVADELERDDTDSGLKLTSSPIWTHSVDHQGETVTTAQAAQMLGVSVGCLQVRYRRTELLVPCQRTGQEHENRFWRNDVEKLQRSRGRIKGTR